MTLVCFTPKFKIPSVTRDGPSPPSSWPGLGCRALAFLWLLCSGRSSPVGSQLLGGRPRLSLALPSGGCLSYTFGEKQQEGTGGHRFSQALTRL